MVYCWKWQMIAGVAELADARDLKSRELIPRAGSIPVSGTKTNLPVNISRGRAARLARRAHNPEVRRFKSPPRNQKRKQSIGLLSFLERSVPHAERDVHFVCDDGFAL